MTLQESMSLNISEREMRSAVEKHKSFEQTLALVENFISNGELVYNGEVKKPEDIMIALDYLEKYCTEEFEEGSDNKREMEERLNKFRKIIESKIN